MKENHGPGCLHRRTSRIHARGTPHLHGFDHATSRPAIPGAASRESPMHIAFHPRDDHGGVPLAGAPATGGTVP